MLMCYNMHCKLKVANVMSVSYIALIHSEMLEYITFKINVYMVTLYISKSLRGRMHTPKMVTCY